MPRACFPVVALATALALSGCCKKGGDSSAAPADAPAKTAEPTSAPPAATPTSTGFPPLEAAKLKDLTAIFEKGKAGLLKCNPLKADMDRTLAAKDFAHAPAKVMLYNTCRRAWVSTLMPQISKLGISEEQAADEMMKWDLNRK